MEQFLVIVWNAIQESHGHFSDVNHKVFKNTRESTVNEFETVNESGIEESKIVNGSKIV